MVQAEKVGCEKLCNPDVEADAAGAFPEVDALPAC
jgi:hypothetical protein